MALPGLRPLMLLVGLVLPTLPGSAVAQAASGARLLDAQAAAAFHAGTPAEYMRATGLWNRAAGQYLAMGWTTDAVAALRNAGLASSKVGADSTALDYYGRAADLQDPVASHQMLVLLDESPLYDPAGRGMAEEARFVGEANKLLQRVSAGQFQPVSTAEDAQKALESLVRSRLATITIQCGSRKAVVELRRWRYSRSQPNAPWERVTTDVTLRRSPAAYDVRYRDPTTNRDTTIMYQCADGCTVEIP